MRVRRSVSIPNLPVVVSSQLRVLLPALLSFPAMNPRLLTIIFVLTLAVLAKPQQKASPTPEFPSDIPKDARVRTVLSDKTPSGQDAVWTTSDGIIHEFFQFNDRGRGPKIYTNYKLDVKGLVIAEDSKGFDYMKNPVEEHFSLDGTNASWKNQAEDTHLSNASGKAYVDLDGGPESLALLTRAALKNGGEIDLLPSGQVAVRNVKSVPIEANGAKLTATLYEVSGLGYEPAYLWLDEDQQFFATTYGWSSTARQGFESVVPTLHKAQQQVENARAAELARALTHAPTGDVVIKNVNLFDSEKAKILPRQRVAVHGDRIVSIAPETGQTAPANAEVIDGSGKTLLPGLWDLHAQLFPLNAFMDVAAGVTTVRDMGNSIEDLTTLRQHIEDGTQIGPRVVRAGFIDGPGAFEGTIKVLAATPQEALARVDRYADLGYVQIKIYSSVKPELVPIIVNEAHKRGLRVSGHVPAGMVAEQFIRDGADEIQHMNFVFLNFMPDIKETRTPERFIAPGKRGADLDLNSPQVNNFIALLKERHIVIDATMGVWESTYTDRQGQVARIDQPIFDRLPVQAQRGIKAGGGSLPVPDDATDKQYRASYAKMEAMLKKLYDSGVQLVSGTDAGNGYALHRELEIYTHAGISASEVLRMATLEGARVMHMDKDFGSVTTGKYADMILVNGDPTTQISDIRRIDLVMKNGKLLRPAELYHAIGVQ